MRNDSNKNWKRKMMEMTLYGCVYNSKEQYMAKGGNKEHKNRNHDDCALE